MTDGSTTRSTTSAAPTTSPFTPTLRTTTIGMIALVALGAFESLAVTTAMPSVVAELGGYALYAAAFAGPVASSVVGLTLAGRWCDRGSPVAALLTGVGLFVVGLLAAGLTSSMLVVVAGRIVQGVGSGVFGVVLYVVVARVYPESAHGRMFGAFAAAWVGHGRDERRARARTDRVARGPYAGRPTGASHSPQIVPPNMLVTGASGDVSSVVKP